MGDVSWSAGLAPRENYPGYPSSNVTGYSGAVAPSFPQFSNQMPSAPMHELSYGYAGAGIHSLGPLSADAFGSAPPQSYSAGPPAYNQPQQMSLLDGLNVPSGNAYTTPPYAPAAPHPSAPSSYPDMGATYPSLQSQPPPQPTAPSSYPTAPSAYPTAPSAYPTAPSSYAEGAATYAPSQPSYSEAGATYAPSQSSYSEGGGSYAPLQSQQPPPPSSYPTAPLQSQRPPPPSSYPTAPLQSQQPPSPCSYPTAPLQSQQPPPPSSYPTAPSSYPTAPSSYPEAGATYPALQSQQPPPFGYSDAPHLQHQQNTGNSYPDFVTGPVPHMSGYPAPQSEVMHSHPSFNRPAAYGSAADTYESPGVSAFPSTVSYESQHSGYDMEEGGEVYAYDGGKEEPYGARGTYGGSQWGDNPGKASGTGGSKAGKSDAGEEDGLQKFHVKLLPDEGMSSSEKRAMSVVCQIGLDGVRLLDPESSRTLRIYPLETITRWGTAGSDLSVFAFWAKSAVDVEERPVRLQSTQRTTTEILDTLTAACVQLVEMRPHTGGGEGKDKAGGDKDAGKAKAASTMSFVPWMTTLSKPAVVEEKEHWVPDENANKCKGCSADFTAFNRRHHCRNCGDIFCDKCTRGRIALTQEEGAVPVRVCDHCLAEVTQRITNAQPAKSTPTSALRSHSDLAKTLQEEMERNSKRASAAAAAAASANKLTLEEGGGRGPAGGPPSVLNCSKCGSVSFVTGGDTKCVSCGTDTSRLSQPSPVTSSMDTWFNHGSGQQSAIQQPSQGQQQGWVPQGPPHLWPSNQGQTPTESGQMREVACPTCTVHLQVKVPASGTETVECGVCEHPFLVPAN